MHADGNQAGSESGSSLGLHWGSQDWAWTLQFEADPRQTTALPRFFRSSALLMQPSPAAIIYVYYPPLCVSLFPVHRSFCPPSSSLVRDVGFLVCSDIYRAKFVVELETVISVCVVGVAIFLN